MSRLIRALLGDDLESLPEADEELNASSRATVTRMHAKHGRVFLGRVNLSEGALVPLWAWDPGEEVKNFSCDFVVPVDDEELRHLILDRHAAEYTGPVADAPRVLRILGRVLDLGGAVLVWS